MEIAKLKRSANVRLRSEAVISRASGHDDRSGNFRVRVSLDLYAGNIGCSKRRRIGGRSIHVN